MDKFSKIDVEDMIFIDESGLHLGMTRAYGRALGRVKSLAPFNKGKRITIVAAIGIDEIKTALYGNWHMDGCRGVPLKNTVFSNPKMSLK